MLAAAVNGSDASVGPVVHLHPAPLTSWQIQLSGTVDTSFDVQLYDLDLFDMPDSAFTDLHGRAIQVVCYFSAGSWENWRDDASAFPKAARGTVLDGWPDERWLDVRDPKVRKALAARLDLASARGCDGVDPDNVDGYRQKTGFPLTAADQLDFNRFLAKEAHARGLAVGLKNDVDQIPDLVDDFDWSLDEECVAFSECDQLSPFIDAGKAVFHVEYERTKKQVCPVTGPLSLSSLIKHRSPLDAWRVACP
jgi:hypothetical protein